MTNAHWKSLGVGLLIAMVGGVIGVILAKKYGPATLTDLLK